METVNYNIRAKFISIMREIRNESQNEHHEPRPESLEFIQMGEAYNFP